MHSVVRGQSGTCGAGTRSTRAAGDEKADCMVLDCVTESWDWILKPMGNVGKEMVRSMITYHRSVETGGQGERLHKGKWTRKPFITSGRVKTRERESELRSFCVNTESNWRSIRWQCFYKKKAQDGDCEPQWYRGVWLRRRWLILVQTESSEEQVYGGKTAFGSMIE